MSRSATDVALDLYDHIQDWRIDEDNPETFEVSVNGPIIDLFSDGARYLISVVKFAPLEDQS